MLSMSKPTSVPAPTNSNPSTIDLIFSKTPNTILKLEIINDFSSGHFWVSFYVSHNLRKSKAPYKTKARRTELDSNLR